MQEPKDLSCSSDTRGACPGYGTEKKLFQKLEWTPFTNVSQLKHS